MKFNITGNTYLISGTVTKSNFKQVEKGDKTYCFSDANVIVDDTLERDDANKYVKLSGKFQNAKMLKGLDKGDAVFAVANLEEREYEGKVYQEYVIEFAFSPKGAQKNVNNNHYEPLKPADEDDLPF
jgi:hypothetical protein